MPDSIESVRKRDRLTATGSVSTDWVVDCRGARGWTDTEVPESKRYSRPLGFPLGPDLVSPKVLGGSGHGV